MHRKLIRALLLLQIVCIAAGTTAFAQVPASDTLKLTVQQAEDQFIKNNLSLIIQRYNIDNASAQIITARLFQNPDFSFANGIHTTGVVPNAFSEQSFSVSQLFFTAGKRNKNIQLAKIGVEQAKYQFFDLLRTLKFTLRNDFYTIYFQQQSAKVYNEEINSLSKTLSVFKEQYAKGNIAQKEVLRIQSQLYSLQTEYNGLLTGIDTTQSELKLLIKASANTYIEPQINLDNKQQVAQVPYQQLLDSAYVNRYDLRYTKAAVDYSTLNLKLQKATAVPDVSLAFNYDKLGSYGNNFMSAGLAFSLPFFNRNQGGIKQARIAIDQSKVQLESQQKQVESDVATNYKGALRLEKLYNSFDPQFKDDFNHLIQEVFKNYEKRNISMLEFLDFYDSYKTNTIQLNNLQLNRIISLEQLNYATGTPFFNHQ
jgi:cobalt-zinc-cadmium efflux system outer membrane protein